MNLLEQQLGYHFQNPKLLKQALTHASVTSNVHENYERLEFLGDRILGLTIADMLCKTFVNESEGDLAQRFVLLVCKETVANVMRGLGVNKYVHTAGGNVAEKDNVLCDVGEAIIAAIYLDSNDIEAARSFVRRHWLSSIELSAHPRKDSKSLLQERAAQMKLPAPRYKLVDRSGPDHEPVFVIEVSIGDVYATSATGRSKKQAEAEAARLLMRRILEKEEAHKQA